MTKINVNNVSVEFQLNQNSGIGFKSKQKVFTVLDDLSLTFTMEDRIGILGHNGAGKTTLLRVLSGLLPPTKGVVEVQGNMHVALTLRTGLLNQASCYENIRLKAYYYGFKGENVEVYIDKVRAVADIEDFIYQPLKTLSNGMRSRLMIAMFLINEHSIIIFDEWVGVLDRTQLDGVASLRRLIDKSDITVFASHNTGFIRKYCNRCVVLDKGMVAFDGSVEEGISHYKSIPLRGQS